MDSGYLSLVYVYLGFFFNIDDLRSVHFRDHPIIKQWEKIIYLLNASDSLKSFTNKTYRDISENPNATLHNFAMQLCQLMSRTEHTYDCCLKYLDISTLDYVREKTQKPTPAKPVPIRSSVCLRILLSRYCLPFQRSVVPPGLPFLLLIYAVSFIE